ncbi:ATP-binding protein [Criibacterium bergeronii]|uniref:ATP-binding protein n=1 Tax=Criibacterium bergeronii TaxID=1871336 RepID=A0A552UXH8_9FIRM|nr:ATP-binding protein [Criibacterium bergeronii]TRW22936.1 ATP-binding protein [Criibacterium bergeronii]
MLIKREPYFSKILGYKDKKIIKVVTGVRRCGKSTLLSMYRQYLLDNGVDTEQIIFINFEDLKYENILDKSSLYEYLSENMSKDKMNYIFLDEVQNVSEFEKVINSVFLRENVDIYITGSNSYMLSGELATFLTGRYIQIEMLPFSLAEYEKILNISDNSKGYRSYIENTSFPYAINLTEKNQKNEYLKGIYNSIVLKDIVQRKNITDVMMLESVLRFVSDNIGSILSTRSISNSMTSNGRSISTKTVESYLNSFMESYLIYKVDRFDVKGKEYLKTLEKYYIVDIGLRNTMLGKINGADLGHILENVVFLELKRRNYELFIGKVGSFEVDFVAKKENEINYFQVALSVRDENTLQRELRPLLMIKDNYPKYILTLDDDPQTTYDGIVIINALEFLQSN